MTDSTLIPTRYFQVSGYVLAGGDSSRMGRDKAAIEVGGLAMVLRAARLLEPLVSKRAAVTVIGPAGRYAEFSLKSIPDDLPGMGPLAGIATAVRNSLSPWSLIVGCDMPFLTTEWLVHLLARGVPSTADIVVAEGAGGIEPLCGLYHKRCEATFATRLARGERKVTDAFAGHQVLTITADEVQPFDPHGLLFKSVNTPEDLAEAEKKMAELIQE
jgi:molybdopterin-guanine dinucleotide biosynthesis protein A